MNSNFFAPKSPLPLQSVPFPEAALKSQISTPKAFGAQSGSPDAVRGCQHMNADGTFKGGFDGCVAHMEQCEGHSEESAKKICGAIAANKSQISNLKSQIAAANESQISNLKFEIREADGSGPDLPAAWAMAHARSDAANNATGAATLKSRKAEATGDGHGAAADAHAEASASHRSAAAAYRALGATVLPIYHDAAALGHDHMSCAHQLSVP